MDINKGVSKGDLWDDIHFPSKTEQLNYDTQKPKALLKRIIKASSNVGDIVADFYLGSGTTAEVCKDLKRNFIGCDINPKSIEITKERLKNTKQQIKDIKIKTSNKNLFNF